MNFDLLSALAAFAFVTSITPGPNNLMLMVSGANFGLRRSLPHMLGIGVGFMFMLGMVGIGLIQVFDAVPNSDAALRVLSVAYMIWLAWKTATAAGIQGLSASGNPMTFLQAAAFQWVNPKGWAMALTAMAAYAPDRSLWAVLTVSLVFGAINLPSVSVWTLLGHHMSRILTNARRRIAFNIAMALLLLASLGPVVLR